MKEEVPYKDKILGKNIYVDLDSLYDIRLAILDTIDPKYAITIYENGYLARIEDSFPFISKEKFKTLLDQRNNYLLAQSLVTGIFTYVKELILETIKNLNNSPGSTDMTLVINVWPYEFDSKSIEYIIKPFYEIGQEKITVRAINVKPDKLDVEYFKKDFSIIIMYHYEEWLNHILATMDTKHSPMYETTLMIPKLFLNKTLDQKELEDIGVNSLDPFKSLELLCLPMINLDFQDIILFSAFLNANQIEDRKKELGLI